MTYIDWGPNFWYKSRIYPVFDHQTSDLHYQGLTANKDPIHPIIGSPDLSQKDHFYSPWPVVNDSDPEKSVLLYFGGWRPRSNLTASEGQCRVPHSAWNEHVGPDQENCTCDTASTVGIDACSGDKIFVATNNRALTQSANKLDYRVYSNDGNFSSGGWSATEGNFKPIVSPALVNAICPQEQCPYAVGEANDPSVVRLKSGKYVMYFTNGFGTPDKWKGFTYVGESDDGINFTQFSILRKTSDSYFPYGLSYNASNGTAKAFYDPSSDTITIVSVADAGYPGIEASNPDIWGIYIYTISASDPSTVIRSSRLSVNDITQYPIGTVLGSQRHLGAF